MAVTVTETGAQRNVLHARWWVVLVLGAVVIALAAWLLPMRNAAAMADDLRIYRGAIDSMLQGHGLYDYSMPVATGASPFLYPPFAALIMLPGQAIPLGSVETGWVLTQMVMSAVLVVVVARGMGWVGRRTVPAAAWALLLLSAPVMYDINLGQISLLIVFLVLVDVVLLPPRWRGALIGIAGAIKLTPMFFVPYFFITKQWRAAATSTISFGVSTLLGFVALPHESLQYWTSVVFQSSRIPNLGSPRNLTILGDLKMWGVPDAVQIPLWGLLAMSVAVLALWAGWRHHRAGEPLAAAVVIGTATTAIGPIAWNHHLIWLIVAGVLMVLSGTRRASVAGWLLLIICCLPSPIWPHEEDPVLWRQVVGMVPLVLSIWISVAGLATQSSGSGPAGIRPAVARRPGKMQP